MYQPMAVRPDSAGNLWVAESSNRALKFVFGQDYHIAGTITNNGATLGAVTVTLSGAASTSTVTALDGTYLFGGLVNGSYTVTPALSGYNFTPAYRAVTVNGTGVPGTDFSVAAAAAVSDPAYAQGGPNGYAEPARGYPAVIKLQAPALSGHVSVKIYTARNARLVRKLETDVTAGTAADLNWDCRDSDGKIVGSGIYVALIKGAGYDEKIRIGVLK